VSQERSECEQLRRDVEVALERSDPLRVLPLLHRLAARAKDGSEDAVFAHRQLAEVLLERDPWRAALHARRVVRMRDGDDRAWAALGLSQSLLGNHQYACHALARAHTLAPDNAWYAHNLGHTLDVALDKPREAVRYLRRAFDRSDKNPDVATALVHALARAGKTKTARALLVRVTQESPSPERRTLLRWIDAGARGRAAVLGVVQLFASRDAEEPVTSTRRTPTRARRSRSLRRVLEDALRRGLSRLPLDDAQQRAAVQLAREAAQKSPPEDESAALGVAAAAAWAVTSRDGIPLSQAEVAACFRTSASNLRQRLPSVRARVKRS